jgi:hypothetical protein
MAHVLEPRGGATHAFSPRDHLPLVAVLALASALFLYRLGASSFFLDEVYTWYTVRADFGELETRLVEQEVTPPLYYVLLHGWVLLTGAASETALRLPSALAGVALVAAIYWLGSLLGGRRAGLAAAGLAAVSPLVLLYAQQVRSYVWAMLAVTVAVAAVIEAVRGRSHRWLVVAGAAGAAAILTHYTAVLVLAPVAGWLLVQDAFGLRARLMFAGALTAPLLALAPLLAEQLSRGHQDWTEQFGRLHVDNMLRLLGTPLDGRFDDVPTLARQAGAAVMTAAVALLALADRLRWVRERRLVAAAAAVPILAVLVTSGLVHPVALTRYTAVAAPFILVAVGVVAAHGARPLGALLVGATLALSIVGVVGAQRPAGRYPDTRGAIATVADRWREGDAILSVNLLVYPDALAYYARRMLPAPEPRITSRTSVYGAVDAPEVRGAARRRERIWLLADPPLTDADLERALGRLGYRARRQWRFTGVVGIQLVLASRTAARG